MRVLWVEDFDKGSVPESILDKVFEGVLSEERRDSLAGTQGLSAGTKRPQGYSDWRTWHGSQPISDEPEIDIYRRAKDFDHLVSSGYIVDRYDAVLLDVNLENSFFESGAELNSSEGGFWLYNKLVLAGFPSSRIALMTAHNSEAATTDFQAGCRRYGHKELRVFGKTNQYAGTWLNELANAKSRFLILRRGVLDGITFAEELLKEHGAKAIRFNLYVGSNEEWSFDQVRDYLDTIRCLLPVQVSDPQISLLGFRYLLACEWERAKPGGDNRIYEALGRVMKYLRSWSSHGHLLDSASVGDIAFLALANLRVGFCNPLHPEDELRSYERGLLVVIGAENRLATLPTRLATSYANARGFLQTLIGNPSRLPNKDGTPSFTQDRSPFHAVVNELANAVTLPASFGFPVALGELFAHSVLSPNYPKIFVAADIQGIKAKYVASLKEKSDDLPAWVKATWARL